MLLHLCYVTKSMRTHQAGSDHLGESNRCRTPPSILVGVHTWRIQTRHNVGGEDVGLLAQMKFFE